MEGLNGPSKLTKSSMFAISKVKAKSDRKLSCSPVHPKKQVWNPQVTQNTLLMPSNKEKRIFFEFDRNEAGLLDCHKIRFDSDPDFRLIMTDSEVDYIKQNYEKTKNQVMKMRLYDENLCLSNSIDLKPHNLE